jgi:hypothetical protein
MSGRSLSSKDARVIANHAAEAAVAKLADGHIQNVVEKCLENFFERLGIDTSTPEARQKARDNFASLSRWNSTARILSMRSYGSITYVIIIGIITAVWQGMIVAISRGVDYMHSVGKIIP